jgi:hypothetical protein
VEVPVVVSVTEDFMSAMLAVIDRIEVAAVLI